MKKLVLIIGFCCLAYYSAFSQSGNSKTERVNQDHDRVHLYETVLVGPQSSMLRQLLGKADPYRGNIMCGYSPLPKYPSLEQLKFITDNLTLVGIDLENKAKRVTYELS